MKTYIFVRAEGFYPLDLPDLDSAIPLHAEMNPGTLRVEDVSGKIIWQPSPERQE